MYANISPSEFLRADPIERLVLLDVTREAVKLTASNQEYLAYQIILKLGQALNKRRPALPPNG